MRLLIFIALILMIQSCNNKNEQKEPFASLLKNCDAVNINFYNAGDSVKFDTEDSLGIKVLSQSVSGDEQTINDTCKPAGQIFYRAKGDTIFRAEFAVASNTDNKNCDYITYSYQGKSYKNRLHDKAYQLLTQIHPKLSADTSSQSDTMQSPDVVVDSTAKAR